MGININVNRINRLYEENAEGLTLLILTDVVKTEDNLNDIMRVSSIDELHKNYEPVKIEVEDPDPENPENPGTIEVISKKGLYQLQVAEYLLNTQTTILVYAVQVPTKFSIAADGKYIKDIKELGYKQILAPYTFVDGTNTIPSELAKLVTPAPDDADKPQEYYNLSAQLYLDLNLDGAFTENTTLNQNLQTQLKSLAGPKIEVFANSGAVQLYSKVSPLPVFGEDGFIGIPASALVAARKAKILKNKLPHLPIAGQTYGAVPEVAKLYKRLSTFEKEVLQANNINVLTYKTGFGALLVSQNTLYNTPNKYEPLKRSHVVTQALWLKREVLNIIEGFEHTLSNTKTWSLIELSLEKLFDQVYDSDGLQERATILLGRATTSQEDLDKGKLNIVINYKPARALESIEVNINILEDTNEIIADVGGIL